MQVRFALLGSLVSSGRCREHRRSELLTGLMFSMLHLAALGSVALAVPQQESAAAPLATVTYLDVPTPAEPASPRALLKPRPVVVSQAVKIPAVEEVVSRPDQAAGFQELLTPREIDQLPPPDPGGRAVEERDFSGRGVAGGVAGGKPPTALPPDLAAALAAQEKITDILAGRRLREIRPVEMTMVEMKPQLLNRDEVLKWLLAQWPPVLKEAGIEGSVVMQFMIDTLGRVPTGSARVISASHPLFANAALEVIPRLQFTPGRMTVGGKLVVVPVNARVPFKWSQIE
jgi:protein TonB